MESSSSAFRGAWLRAGLLACVLAAGPATAADNVQVIQSGKFGDSEASCTQIAFLFSGADCSYGRDKPAASPTWIGPNFGGGHYAYGSAEASPYYVPQIGDAKVETPVTGTVTIDDNDTPGIVSDDRIGMDFAIGALARNLATGQATRAVEYWTTINHVVSKQQVNPASSCSAGTCTYIIGDQGIPPRHCKEGSTTATPEDCYATEQAVAFNAPDNTFWNDIAAGGIGIERTPDMGGHNGFTSSASFVGYGCSDTNGTDCAVSTILWGAAEDPGFDNITGYIKTGAGGVITEAFLYWTQEYKINFGGPAINDNSWQGGTISFGGGSSGGADGTYVAAASVLAFNPFVPGGGPLTGPIPFSGTCIVSGGAVNCTGVQFSFASSNSAFNYTNGTWSTTVGGTSVTKTQTCTETVSNPCSGPSSGLSGVWATGIRNGDQNPSNSCPASAYFTAGACDRISVTVSNGVLRIMEQSEFAIAGFPSGYVFEFNLTGPPAAVATDDQFTIDGNSSDNVLNVPANDFGFTDPVTVEITTPPAHGTATVMGSPGAANLVRIQYTPTLGYSGPDAFIYSMDDGTSSDSATVTLNVVAPTAGNDSTTTMKGVPVSIDVLANDDGFKDPVTVTVFSGPDHGTATVTGSPGNASVIRINYTPALGYSGPDTFVYQVTDGVSTDTASVDIDVFGHDAVDDEFTVLRDGGTSYFYVAKNDVGFKNPVTIEILQYPNKGGHAYIGWSPANADQVYIDYHSHGNSNPLEYVETITYRISDGIHEDTATVNINVVLFAAVPDSANTSQGVPVVIDVKANDIGFNWPQTLGIFTNPLHGSVTVLGSPGNQTIRYTPAPGFLGTDTFEYAIDDGNSRIDTALVTVRVILDADGDLVDDTVDNCLGRSNPSQLDANGDGFGNRCDADLNNDGKTNFADLAIFRSRFATTDAEADFDGNGNVNFADLSIISALFGTAPGPSALVP